MAACFAPASISGGSHLKAHGHWSKKSNSFLKTPQLAVQRKTNRKLSVCAEYRDGSRGGGGEFIAGFLIGGAIFGTAAYVFAPQIRRAVLNEDEHGFRRPRKLAYHDDGIETTRDILNEKISQLNSAIDKVSSRLRGGKNPPTAPAGLDPESEVMM